MNKHGFTLLEMSVVMVIIALIAGGIIMGESLVRTSRINSVLKQVSEYQTAVVTFKVKFNTMPGDITPKQATQFGMVTRAGTLGRGDSNGLIQGHPSNGLYTQSGEANLFWNDLSRGLGVGGFYGGDCSPPSCDAPTPSAFMPQVKLGEDNYVSIYGEPDTQKNYFRIISFGRLEGYGLFYEPLNLRDGSPHVGTTFSGMDTYRMDAKIDDGYPLTGRVTAILQKVNASSTEQPVLDTPAAPAQYICVSNASADNPYNILTSTGGATASCVPRFELRF